VAVRETRMESSFLAGMQSAGMATLRQLRPEDVRNALAVVVVAFAASSFVTTIVKLVKIYFYDPLRISRIMTKQGVRGPPFIPILGSALEIGAFEKTLPESMPLDEHYGLLPTVKSQFHLFFPRFGKFSTADLEPRPSLLASISFQSLL
jgi:hypothetical protein